MAWRHRKKPVSELSYESCGCCGNSRRPWQWMNRSQRVFLQTRISVTEYAENSNKTALFCMLFPMWCSWTFGAAPTNWPNGWKVYFYGPMWTVIVLVSRGRGNQFYLFRWPSEDDQEENFINEWNDNLRIKAAVVLLATIRQAQKVHLQPQNTRQVNWKVAWNGQVGVTEDCPIG